MVNLIVCGHGEIAHGLKSSLSVIAGDFEHINFITFTNDQEKLKNEIEEIINSNPDSEFLVLTDLVGGTPFKMAALIAKDNKKVKVIGGVNLPMLLSIVYDSNNTVEELTTLALKSGMGGIKEFA